VHFPKGKVDEGWGNAVPSLNLHSSLRFWRSETLARFGDDLAYSFCSLKAAGRERAMINLDAIKITPRDEEVLRLLAQGCSNKEIAGQLNISPRTVKQHLRTLFLRAGITDGRKRVKLATAVFAKEQMESCNPAIS
jgi:DNA-binding CsgD family transcriptional regulator